MVRELRYLSANTGGGRGALFLKTTHIVMALWLRENIDGQRSRRISQSSLSVRQFWHPFEFNDDVYEATRLFFIRVLRKDLCGKPYLSGKCASIHYIAYLQSTPQ